MPGGYLQIPDWLSIENQGGGVAVADVSGNGQRDLVVFMVDAPAGQNRGLYRIGRNLGATGAVTGGWTPWIDVPDWFAWENQGAGIAVADLDNDGNQNLVVLMLDNTTAQNWGYYRVGKALDVNGNVNGGWGPWIPIPDWFSRENQYGSIALADLDGDGSMELLVLMVDELPEQNRGLYRIGRMLDANGNVRGGWTPWIDVPDWFSWDNQGVGIAVTDFTATGQSDLLVMMIDNPPGQNGGWYRTLPLDTDPRRDGQWELLSFHSGVLAVHAALLPQGKVLFFAGSGSSALRFDSPDFGNLAKGS